MLLERYLSSELVFIVSSCAAQSSTERDALSMDFLLAKSSRRNSSFTAFSRSSRIAFISSNVLNLFLSGFPPRPLIGPLSLLTSTSSYRGCVDQITIHIISFFIVRIQFALYDEPVGRATQVVHTINNQVLGVVYNKE